MYWYEWYVLVLFGMYWYELVCIGMNGMNGMIGMNWYDWYELVIGISGMDGTKLAVSTEIYFQSCISTALVE